MTSSRLRVSAGTVGQLVRFAGVGAATTVAYLVLYAALRTGTGALTANLVAAVATTVVSTTLHRWFTFGLPRGGSILLQQAQGLLLFGLGFGLTSGALEALQAFITRPARVTELAVLVLATGAAGLFRFVMLRSWVFAVR